jgi:4-hydroxy-tetrahydrodipicolinate synthase
MKSITLSGVIPPLVSPLHEDESIDKDSLRRLIEHVLAGGVDGIFVLGSSGEGPMLSLSQRRQLVDVATEAIGGRVPLLVGVSESSVTRVRETMAALSGPGVDAFVATLPFYGDFADAAIQKRFFQQLADSSPKPLVIYNIPQAVHANIEPETVAALATHPNIVALKDSCGDLTRFHRTLMLCRDHGLAVFQGAELISGASLYLGASGLVAGLGNLVPGWLVELHRAAKQGDWARVNSLQERLARLWPLHTHGHWLACLKTAASLLGLCGPAVSSPIPCPSAEGTMRIRETLRSMELL